jgi:hypothetical protein
MNQQVMELQQLMETEKKRKERAVEALERESGGPVMQLLNANVGALGIHELEELRKELCMYKTWSSRGSQGAARCHANKKAATTISYAYGGNALASFVWWHEGWNHVYHISQFEQWTA